MQSFVNWWFSNFSKFSSIFDKNFSKFNTLNFGIGGDKIQNVLWRMNNMSLPPYLQYIFIHCGTNNIGHNDPEFISDGLINLVWVIKKYKNVKIIISSLLPRDKADSQKCSLVIATSIYLKEECGRVALWLATCARKPKVPCSSPAASYVQRWALCSNYPTNV